MGFFDLKAVCGACDKEVGLNRFKIKKSNAWVCPECIKQAGGIARVDVSKVTIEEIRSIITAKQTRVEADPMATAEGMYQFCLEHKFGSGFNEKWGVKHFGVIENNLMDEETVLMTFIGLHNFQSTTKHDSNYAYAITNKRILFGQKSITGQKFKSVAYERINDLTFKSGLVFGVLTIDTPQEKFNVGLDKGSAVSINNRIHQVLDGLKTGSYAAPAPPPAAASLSVPDELKKYKELADAGIITQEEFAAKKKQLLSL